MQINDNLISSLEDSSCLSLSAGEKCQLKEDMQKILGSFSQLSGLNTDGIPECIHPFDNVNVFRDDEILPSFDRELILKNASVKNNEFFITPGTI